MTAPLRPCQFHPANLNHARYSACLIRDNHCGSPVALIKHLSRRPVTFDKLGEPIDFRFQPTAPMFGDPRHNWRAPFNDVSRRKTTLFGEYATVGRAAGRIFITHCRIGLQLYMQTLSACLSYERHADGLPSMPPPLLQQDQRIVGCTHFKTVAGRREDSCILQRLAMYGVAHISARSCTPLANTSNIVGHQGSLERAWQPCTRSASTSRTISLWLPGQRRHDCAAFSIGGARALASRCYQHRPNETHQMVFDCLKAARTDADAR